MSNVEGKIKLIGETQTFGANAFRKRELVVTTDEQYPQDIMIELVQDKCELLDKFKVGQNISVGINLRGREWVNPQGESKWFNSLQGWKIDPLKEAQQQPKDYEPEEFPDHEDEDYDDLPF